MLNRTIFSLIALLHILCAANPHHTIGKSDTWEDLVEKHLRAALLEPGANSFDLDACLSECKELPKKEVMQRFFMQMYSYDFSNFKAAHEQLNIELHNRCSHQLPNLMAFRDVHELIRDRERVYHNAAQTEMCDPEFQLLAERAGRHLPHSAYTAAYNFTLLKTP